MAAKEEFSGLDAVSELLKDKDIETNEQGRRLLEQYGYWGNKGNAFYMQFRHQVMVTGAVSTVICVLFLTFLLYWKKKEDACHQKILDQLEEILIRFRENKFDDLLKTENHAELEKSVEQSLNTLISNTSHIKMDTYHAQLQSAEFASSMMKLGCYLFMAIVGLIGFMNMANTMIMNITTKKQEYGVLQAVGMTNKQLNLCLQLQGLIFTVGTICVALIIGLPLGYALFSYAKHNGIFGMNIYHVPIVPIFIMIFLVGLLQIVLSCVLSSNLKKETLVERIRYQG